MEKFFAKKQEKKFSMMKELDSNGIYHCGDWHKSYSTLLSFYEKYYHQDYLLAEIFAYVVMRHEITPYLGSIGMARQDARMQKCHRIILDHVIGTQNEKCIQHMREYQEYCANLGPLYYKYLIQNRNRGISNVIYNKDFMITPLPLTFIRICNEIYGDRLGS